MRLKPLDCGAGLWRGVYTSKGNPGFYKGRGFSAVGSVGSVGSVGLLEDAPKAPVGMIYDI